ncbi:MAG: tRNA (guanosine(37)-N1)-methyltransferase TrmD [Candidatus Marinimicrobia bacterium]|nr:tRNA (guanosine(37)-N1)-methyltransferase TrmD [Candidatus Neomarinimicrobiota bacterium]|tara:strand:- start:8969 stop:9667 length:699 start_codon:yes stop_codon:yes gene_type:complete
MLNCTIMTIFPEVVGSFINQSIIKRSKDKKIVEYKIQDIRDFADPPHFKTDDYPFGGGEGMIFKPEPFFRAYDYAIKNITKEESLKVVFPTPDGDRFNHNHALDLSKADNLIFICGHYKGIDQRIRDEIVTDEFSVGDFVVTGGELPTCMMIDAAVRLIPGVLNNYESAKSDSFFNKLLDGPHYTRPEDYRGLKVPEVLLSGHHEKIKKWRKDMRKKKTKDIRPDIWKKYNN